MIRRLEGVVGTPVTPFTDRGDIDWSTLEKLVGFLLGHGIQALALPMHIGESLNLSVEERQRMAEAVVALVGKRVPVLINVSLSGTGLVTQLAQHSQRVGADGIIVLPPYYWQPAESALLDHFIEIGKSVEISLIAYNFPAKLGVAISRDLIAKLLGRLDNFIGLKDASLDMEYLSEICTATADLRPGFSVFTGVEFFLPGMLLGAAGAFSAAGAVAPNLVRNLYEACRNRDITKAQMLQERFSRLWRVLRIQYPAGIKAALEIMGRPVGQTRRPIAWLSESARGQMRNDLLQLGILEDEPIGWSS